MRQVEAFEFGPLCAACYTLLQTMIECPRCGFTQPKDKYCANCGVDIESYRPEQKPLHTRLFNSPIFYLVGLAIGIALFTAFILKQPQKEILDLKVSSTAQSAPEKSIPKGSMKNTKLDNQEVAPQVEAPTKSEPVLMAKKEEKENASTQVTTDEADLAKKPKMPETLSVSFFEMSQSAINEIYKKGQVVEESSDFQSLTFNSTNPKTDLKSFDPELESLPGSKSDKFKSNATILFNYNLSIPDSGEDLGGLTLQIIVGEVTANRTTIDLAGEISIKVSQEQTITTNLGGTYQVDASHSVVFIGMLPRQALEDKIASQVQSTPLSILTSNNFVNPESVRPTEFLMVIQVK